MKVGMGLTYDKAIFYYSMTGNTKALVELSDTSGFDVFNMSSMKFEDINLEPYEMLLIGTSTVGDGIPHEIFKKLSPQLKKLKDKKIGLFGSGNTIYPHYCGALDLLEDLLKPKNEIMFIFRFESYPKESVIKEFQEILYRLREE